jgi:hypothetical protein
MALRKEGFFSACLAIVLFSLIVASANAQSVVNKEATNRSVPYRGDYDGTIYDFVVSPNPSPASPVTLSSTEVFLLGKDFPNWAFGSITPFTLLPGNLTVVYYDGGLAKQVDDTPLQWEPAITHDFQVDYINSSKLSLQPGNVIEWIQFVTTNDPVAAGTGAAGTKANTPYIDPYDYDWNIKAGKSNAGYSDGTPFYWTAAQNKSNSYLGKVVLRFTDAPARPFNPDAINLKTITWEADLYLALWNQSKPGRVTVDPNGVRWGFNITATPTGEAVPEGTENYTHGGIAGLDKYDWTPGNPLNGTAPTPVGGYAVLIAKTKAGESASYFGLVSTILLATVARAVCVKRAKRRKEKQ